MLTEYPLKFRELIMKTGKFKRNSEMEDKICYTNHDENLLETTFYTHIILSILDMLRMRRTYNKWWSFFFSSLWFPKNASKNVNHVVWLSGLFIILALTEMRRFVRNQPPFQEF